MVAMVKSLLRATIPTTSTTSTQIIIRNALGLIGTCSLRSKGGMASAAAAATATALASASYGGGLGRWQRGVVMPLSTMSTPPWRVHCSPSRLGFVDVPSSPRWMWSFSPSRWIRNSSLLRKRSALNKSAPDPPLRDHRSLYLHVDISFEETCSPDQQLLNIAEMLRLNAPMAMKVAFDGLKDSNCKTRDSSIEDLGNYEKAELSILLCNDDFIQQLNREQRNEDCVTDVISIPSHMPGVQLPILMLGDIVISIDAAARQAEERGHNLLDEVRILMVHGLLHLLGYDHEKGKEAEIEMEKEENIILTTLKWKGKGLIHSTYEKFDSHLKLETGDSAVDIGNKKSQSPFVHSCMPKFKYLFCDMDGTLLNSQSQISERTAEALKEAVSRGVKVIIATGKARPAVISAFKVAYDTEDNGIVSKTSPGVFLQGLLVYGTQGYELYRRSLDLSICKKAFQFSLDNQVPLVGFSDDRVFTLFDHPLVESLHTQYHEPKAEVMASVDELVASFNLNKLLLLDTIENIHDKWRPYWSSTIQGSARVVQALPDMLEIIPAGASKGNGVHMLLDHLGASADEAMAIGDGENDVEMLQLARWGVVMDNGSDSAKAVADAIVSSNDEDGVADAIYRFIL